MSRLLMLLPAVLLVLCGCSDDQDPAPTEPNDDTYDVLEFGGTYPGMDEGLARLYAGDNPLPQDSAEGACFAAALHDRLDPEALEEAGITDHGSAVDTLPVFDEATAQAWVDAELSCVSYVDAATRAFLVQSKGAVDADAFGSCLQDAIDDGQVRAALVDLLSGDYNTDEVAALTTAQADCATASR